MRAYDAVLSLKPDYANRVSYVIAPDGKVIYSYVSLNPDKHVANTLEAVRQWRKTHPA
jgi:peroxiredoxin